MFENIKEEQKRIIENNHPTEYWIKEEIINILDLQISSLPLLDQQQYTFLINSAEHPNGYKLSLTAHPTLRIRSGKIVRDSGGNPDSFFWDEELYNKNKRKSIYYMIGSNDGTALENFVRLCNKIKLPEDVHQLAFKVASRKNNLEVMETPAEQRFGREVTKELQAVLPELLESYNNEDSNSRVKLEVGDLLVKDSNGFYYRVEKSLKEKTYKKGILRG